MTVSSGAAGAPQREPAPEPTDYRPARAARPEPQSEPQLPVGHHAWPLTRL